jgi:hypothetical protein
MVASNRPNRRASGSERWDGMACEFTGTKN